MTMPSRQFLITQAVLTGAQDMRSRLFVQHETLGEWLDMWTFRGLSVGPALEMHIRDTYRRLVREYS